MRHTRVDGFLTLMRLETPPIPTVSHKDITSSISGGDEGSKLSRLCYKNGTGFALHKLMALARQRLVMSMQQLDARPTRYDCD